jgi:hypothetical protein
LPIDKQAAIATSKAIRRRLARPKLIRRPPRRRMCRVVRILHL